MLGGSAWGELWAARRAGLAPFSARDLRFLETIAGQIAAAVGRTELYARMADLAFKDPLTGVGNRRALEEQLELSAREARERGGDVAVLLADLDNLKELNDSLGHARGDQALAAVAAALTAEVDAADGAGKAVYRLGGDEFCLLLTSGTAEEAHAAGERAIARLADARPPAPVISASFGVASIGLGAGRPADLLRAADHALYIAKRTGRSRVCVADANHDAVWDGVHEAATHVRRRLRSGSVLDADALLRRSLADLDGELSVAGPFQRLQAVVAQACGAIDAARASISFEAAGSGSLATFWTVNLRAGKTWSKGAGPGADAYSTDDYPETARIIRTGGSFVVSSADPAADPGEVELLLAFKMSAVLAAAAPGDGGSWLVEIYADGQPEPLEQLEPTVRVLVSEAVRPRLSLQPVRSAAVA
jgi:diguanylate cyclase (GGDEF)-like protein